MPRKYLVLFLVSLVLFGKQLAYAQWQLNGVALTGLPNEQSSPAAVSDGVGGAILVWTDFRAGNGDIYVQRVNAAGATLWTANGVAVCNAIADQAGPSIVSDGAGGAIIAWHDFRNAISYDIFAQRVNASGVVQWAANGVQLCNAANNQLNPRMASDGAGGAVLGWQDFRTGVGYDVFAQRVNGAGAPQWPANGVSVCSFANDQYDVQVASVGVGGFIVVWYDLRFGVADPDIYGQRVTPAGLVQWNVDGRPVCGVVGIQTGPHLVSDGAGGAVVSWDDRRAGNYDVYAQRIDAAGVVQWGLNGLAISATVGDQAGSLIVSDGAGGAAMAWGDWRSGTADVYAQRVSAFGATIWTQHGVPMCTFGNDQFPRSITPDESGGFVVAWADYRGIPATDIYAQRVTSAGATQWTVDGVAVCTAFATQDPTSGIADGAGGTFVAWTDYRSGGAEVYVGRLDNVHGFPGHPEPFITSVKDVKHDQGGKVAVNWTASSDDLINPRTIDFYSVWRAVDAIPFGASTVSLGDLEESTLGSPDPVYLVTPGYYFERVGTQSAHGWPGYSLAVPTRADSVVASAGDERFMVAAHYLYDNFVAFASNVVVGHSVDNLAPAAPLFLTAQRVGSDVQLRWNRVKVPDLRDYSLYRATASGVTPIPINFLVSADDTLAMDANAPSSALYYIVTALDVHANQSAASNEAQVSPLTGIGDTPAINALTVLQNHPNPFTATTDFEIGLPAASDVSIDVFDVTGRRVTSIDARGVGAGWQQIPFAGRDRDGRPLASGVYFYRVTAKGSTITRKMVLAR